MVLLLALGVVALATVSLIANLRRAPLAGFESQHQAELRTNFVVSPDDAFPHNRILSSDDEYAEIWMVPTRLDQASNTMSLLLDPFLSPKLKSRLVNAATGQSIAQLTTLPNCRSASYALDPEYAGLSIAISLLVGGRLDEPVQSTVQVPLQSLFAPPYCSDTYPSDLIGTPRDVSARTLDNVPLIWDSSLYPPDTFYVSMSLEVDLPPSVVWQDSAQGATNRLQPAPLSELATFSQFGGEIVDVDTVDSFTGAGGVLSHDYQTPYLELWISRPAAEQWYLIAGASTPLLLLLLSPIFLIGRRADDETILRDSIIGYAAVTLTVLPLRAVLVPQNIPGLTRIDNFLGLDVALLILAVVALYGWEVRRGRKRSSESSNLTH